MKNKIYGFTLIELLVAMFCASLVLASLSGSIYFISKISSEIISDSSINYKISNIKDYIINNKIIASDDIKLDDGDFYYMDKLVIEDTGIISIDFYIKDVFNYSNITYQKSRGVNSLEFIVTTIS